MRLLTQDHVSKILLSSGCELIGEYSGTKKNATVRCLKNNHIWVGKPKHILKGNGCPICNTITKEQSAYIFYSIMDEKGYKVLEEYTGSTNRVKVICNNGHLSSVVPSGVKDNHFCRLCRKLSIEIINKRLINRHISICGTFTNVNEKSDFLCLKCNKQWSAIVHAVLSRTGCPHCSRTTFKPKEPAYFYVYELERDGVIGIGFGVTNNLENRKATHQVYFNKTNTIARLISTTFYTSGEEAVKRENRLKKNKNIIDFGIKGFRNECLPPHLKELVLEE